MPEVPPSRLTTLFLVAALVGCGSDVTIIDSAAPAGVGGSTATGPPSLQGAPGIRIDKVTINQGVQRLLAQDGAPQASIVPLIAGRNALLRVHYTADDLSQIGEPALGRLTFADGTVIDKDFSIFGHSTDDVINSTLNFELSGDAFDVVALDYSVAILQETQQDNPNAHHPAVGTEAHPIEGARNKIRIELVPYQYNADGSGRLPDTSPEAQARYRDRFQQLYPVSEVEVSVHGVVQWDDPILSDGTGWQDVMERTYQLRASEFFPDVYYYGIFNPTPSLSQFCSGGCLLGVTLLNSDPVDTGSELLRWAIGLGYLEMATETATHEIGHSHGRSHAPCGGPDPDSIDPAYPYGNGSIGVWGWDIVNKKLVNPNKATDFMGYCNNEWISDYSYRALYERGKNINQAKLQVEKRLHDIVALDGAGGAKVLGQIQHAGVHSLEGIEVFDSEGGSETVIGSYYAYDHLPGGWLMVPSAGDTARIEGAVAGTAFVALGPAVKAAP